MLVWPFYKIPKISTLVPKQRFSINLVSHLKFCFEQVEVEFKNIGSHS